MKKKTWQHSGIRKLKNVNSFWNRENRKKKSMLSKRLKRRKRRL